MKTKFFLTGLVMAAVVFVSCGRSNQSNDCSRQQAVYQL